jgi:hypothetical protein
VSGGGGWGIKQGLLSLDPQTTPSITDEPRFDNSTQSIEQQQATALGDLASPGSFIQFYTADSVSMPSTSSTSSSTVNDWNLSVVIGTVPSTIDDVPDTSAKKSKIDGGKDMEWLCNHLGVVSESGIYLESRPLPINPKTNSEKLHCPVVTKIDMPFSSVILQE